MDARNFNFEDEAPDKKPETAGSNEPGKVGDNKKDMEPIWIVNDLGELGVKIGNRFFFLYKGESLEYENGTHDDGSPIMWRAVGKREFGECQHPASWIEQGYTESRYTVELTPGIGCSELPPESQWQPLKPSSPA